LWNWPWDGEAELPPTVRCTCHLSTDPPSRTGGGLMGAISPERARLGQPNPRVWVSQPVLMECQIAQTPVIDRANRLEPLYTNPYVRWRVPRTARMQAVQARLARINICLPIGLNGDLKYARIIRGQTGKRGGTNTGLRPDRVPVEYSGRSV